jgi:hypothetical protein
VKGEVWKACNVRKVKRVEGGSETRKVQRVAGDGSRIYSRRRMEGGEQHTIGNECTACPKNSMIPIELLISSSAAVLDTSTRSVCPSMIGVRCLKIDAMESQNPESLHTLAFVTHDRTAAKTAE